ncbi:BspA family leucine-rich repeat surface protein [Mycoplasma putrefaciens]|uniref:PARCEL domain-containing protein n=1 Tax=Mycoplasma putrefaciens Mput9231 TaxID=1292033 RepID=M9WHH6_9MOLU|nr:BspA family leucine-rich repeat surface protein [Mycoplasma putrefaciens]AGJ90915.1 Hypothetical protein, DUF285 family,predicted transmembrane protein [Mycoplasma putrefaciens Mput9231]
MKKLLSILGVTGVVVGTGSFAIAYSINKSSSVKEQVKPEGLTYKTSPQELDLNKDFNLDLYIKEKSEHNPERILKVFLSSKINKELFTKYKLDKKDFKVSGTESNWNIEIDNKNYKNVKVKLNVIDKKTFERHENKLKLILKLQEDAFGTFHTHQDVLDQISVYAKDDGILGIKALRLDDSKKAKVSLENSTRKGKNIIKFRFFDQEVKFEPSKVLKNEVETKYININDFGWKITQIGYKLKNNASIVLDIAKYKKIYEVPSQLPLKVNSLEKAFYQLESDRINNLDKWNISNIKSLLSTFDGAKKFNQDISDWDTSNVTNMQSTFNNAEEFNSPLDGWKVYNVIKMDGMFEGAKKFDKSLNSWTTSNVTDMSKMFWGAKSFMVILKTEMLEMLNLWVICLPKLRNLIKIFQYGIQRMY